ncbi:MAG: peptide deformylase [Lachnospiraceae bacterium]|nr:peptide deformylase [Lachnospiraceae bacterium]
MAIRQIREYGDDILEKPCKDVKEMTPRLKELVDDMLETMYEAGGVGLAAPQVGVLKKIIVIDVSSEGDEPLVFVNPELLETDGEQEGYEGCLSLPGKSGIVKRPNHVKVKAFDRDMQPFELEGDELLARAICHELDHLDGIMYVEKMEGELVDNEDLVEQNAEEEAE